MRRAFQGWRKEQEGRPVTSLERRSLSWTEEGQGCWTHGSQLKINSQRVTSSWTPGDQAGEK